MQIHCFQYETGFCKGSYELSGENYKLILLIFRNNYIIPGFN